MSESACGVLGVGQVSRRFDSGYAVRQAGPMTRLRPTARLALIAAALSAFIVPLTACSGNDEAQAFCDQAEAAFAEVSASDQLGDDPAEFAQAVSDQSDGFASIEPPSEISGEWGVLTQVYADLDDALSSVDLSDTESYSQVLADFSEMANAEKLTTAFDAIGSYLSENCEG